LLKSDEILFTGHIPDEELFAFYQASGVFLSLSEHEGFCLPLIESMIFDLPVIALDSTAVPYTLDGAGVLIRDSRADLVGELVEIVAHDERLREKILKGQRRRLEKYRSQDWQGFLLEKVRSLGP
jgi:glycosyltransferase involved in cell wall biosynthesis